MTDIIRSINEFAWENNVYAELKNNGFTQFRYVLDLGEYSIPFLGEMEDVIKSYILKIREKNDLYINEYIELTKELAEKRGMAIRFLFNYTNPFMDRGVSYDIIAMYLQVEDCAPFYIGTSYGGLGIKKDMLSEEEWEKFYNLSKFEQLELIVDRSICYNDK